MFLFVSALNIIDYLFENYFVIIKQRMILEYKLKEFLTYRHTTIMLLKRSETDGYMVTYKESLLEEPYITIYKVLGGKMSLENGISYSEERKMQAEPQGVLVINCVGHRLYLTKFRRGFV